MILSVNRTRTRTAKWNIVFHGISIGLGFVSGIVTFPLNVAYIPLDLYGAWLASGNVIAWATVFNPGLSDVTQQAVGKAYGAKDTHTVGLSASAGLVLNISFAMFLSVVAFGIVFFLPLLIKMDGLANSDQLMTACYISSFGIFLNVTGYALVAVNQGMQSSLGIGLIYSVSMLTAIIIQIYMLMLGYGVISIAMGTLVRGGGMVVGNIIYMLYRFWREQIKFSIHRQVLIQTLKSTSYTSISRAASAISSNLDSYIMTKLFNNESAPIFQATKAPAGICNAFVTRPIVAIAPIISHLSLIHI